MIVKSSVIVFCQEFVESRSLSCPPCCKGGRVAKSLRGEQDLSQAVNRNETGFLNIRKNIE